MALTTIQQGNFVSTGANVTIPLRTGVDWMYVYNVTAATNTGAAVGVKYYWQNGFPAGSQWITTASDAAATTNLEAFVTTGGFTFVDSSVQVPQVLNASITAVSNAAPPVVTYTAAAGSTVAAGNIVRLFNIDGAPQFGGFDFTAAYNTISPTTFSLDYASTLAVAGTTAQFRIIPFDPYYYPRRRFITKITKAAQAVVTLSVTHGYQVGQIVRMVVPAAYGMVEMNNIAATIVAIDTTVTTGNTITLNVDSTSFTTFAWPIAAGFVAFTPAETVPVGEDTAFARTAGVNVVSDATVNTAFIGMTLTGGAGYPAGANGNLIYWQAGSAFSNLVGIPSTVPF